MVPFPKMAILSPNDDPSLELGHPELVQKLIARIEAKGPMTFVDFMETALYDPEFGYYNQGRIGADGDYWTSPEVHRIFAHLIARQIAQAADDIAPAGPFAIVEMGAGKGTFAGHLLKAFQRAHPALLERSQYLIIERSAAMVKRQQAHLDSLVQEGVSIRWLPDLAALPAASITGVIFSNELVDAFPVHRIVKRQMGLREIFVGWSRSQGFTEIEAPPVSRALEHYFTGLGIRLEDGQRAEVNLEAIGWMRQVAACLSRGIVLTIDYGHTASDLFAPARKGGTLLCYYRATVCDNPYIRIGQQDMTAHVDFTTLALTGQEAGLAVTGFTNQLHFLMGLGIDMAFDGIDPESPESVHMRQLLRPEGMGGIFKVLVQHKGMPAPILDGLQSRPFLVDALCSGALGHG